MRLNWRIWIFAALLVLICIVAWRAFRTRSERPGEAATPTNHTTATPAPLITSATPQNARPADNPPSVQIAAERKQQLQKFFNTPIDFFGKVVDEQGRPIAAAKTFYLVGSDNFAGSPTLPGPDTDQNGLFSITGKHGPDLSVWTEHADYYKTASADRIFEYSSRQYTPGKEPPPLPAQDSPAIFVLRKKGAAESLIYLKKTRVSLPMNGTPITVNVRTGKADGGSEAITFILKSEADKLPINAFHPFNWSVTIQVPNGGLVERVDALNFEAPPGKYRSEVVSENDPSKLKGDWRSLTKRHYFLSFGSGVYGRVRVEVSGEKGRVIAESFLNPTPGSRNLEFDSSKVVSSP